MPRLGFLSPQTLGEQQPSNRQILPQPPKLANTLGWQLLQVLASTLLPHQGWGLEGCQGSMEQPYPQTLGQTLEKLQGALQASDQLAASQVHTPLVWLHQGHKTRDMLALLKCSQGVHVILSLPD